MGYTHWSDDAYDHIKTRRKGASKREIFKNDGKMDPAMSPRGVDRRESRDSEAHPRSNAVIVAFDVTGSMGSIPEQFAREKLGGLMRMLVERGYIEDPQLLFAAIGDATCDQAPLQIGQFESGLEMDMWLTRIWIEGRGGGVLNESYSLAHYFAAHHTAADCWDKRRKKGYLFTMGDEPSWGVEPAHVEAVFGTRPEKSLTLAEAIAEAQERYHVFHIHVAQGHNGGNPAILQSWRDALGERALVLEDTNAVCELIAGTIGLCEGNVDMARLARDLHTLGATDSAVKAVSTALAPLSASAPAPRASLAGALPPSSRPATSRL